MLVGGVAGPLKTKKDLILEKNDLQIMRRASWIGSSKGLALTMIQSIPRSALAG
jgi:hypothetical protein